MTAIAGTASSRMRGGAAASETWADARKRSGRSARRHLVGEPRSGSGFRDPKNSSGCRVDVERAQSRSPHGGCRSALDRSGTTPTHCRGNPFGRRKCCRCLRPSEGSGQGAPNPYFWTNLGHRPAERRGGAPANPGAVNFGCPLGFVAAPIEKIGCCVLARYRRVRQIGLVEDADPVDAVEGRYLVAFG